MKKFPDILPELGMRLEYDYNDGYPMATIWEGEAVICLGVGVDLADCLRRAEPWFWEVMVERMLEEMV